MPYEFLVTRLAIAHTYQSTDAGLEQVRIISAAILSAIRELMNPPQPKRRPIGFTANLDQKG